MANQPLGGSSVSPIESDLREWIDLRGQIDAISRSQMVIQFGLDGTVLDANPNFLSAMGYSLDEIQGKHHRIFVPVGYANSEEYQEFWASLNAGNFRRGEFMRLDKQQRPVWIQATYSPILDQNGKPFKVVKYATNINEQVHIIQAVRESANSLGDAARELLATSEQMGDVAQQTSSEANSASISTRQVNDNVKAVTDSSKALSTDILAMTDNVREAAKMATHAVEQVCLTDETVSSLGSSSAEIGEVIKLITAIAKQTNLLALNATIEAARAGDAGRGFAVVANEVKELARETANATDQISQKVENIQNGTEDAVLAIKNIAGTINQINAIQADLSLAFELQAETTGNIHFRAVEASEGTEEVAQSITRVAQSAMSAAGSSDQTRSAAESLSHTAEHLQALVARFKY